MSSHREAPQISKDPVADSTDLYAFISPDRKGTVTLIANYIPVEDPAGGPNFYEFGDDVLYEIHVDHTGDGIPDLTYQFNFKSEVTIPGTFLYNDGPILSLTSKNWNRRQNYSVTKKLSDGSSEVIGHNLACPPCNIGPLSTPNYATLAKAAIHSVGANRYVFAGQRAEAFFVDLGAVFDLGDLRPIANLHAMFGLGELKAMPGVNTLLKKNVHSIAIQVPISDLTGGHVPTNPALARSTIGVFTTASRRKARVLNEGTGTSMQTGPYVQISRLGNPLVNEVLIPLSQKDQFNSRAPYGDVHFARNFAHPELAGLLNVLYPGAFPNLAAYTKPRADLEAILLTGIPAGVVSETFSTFTGTTQADMLRLNVAIPPTAKPNPLGVLGGDVGGYPNGRRLIDDVVHIELQAIAGATIPLVDKTFTPDKALAAVTDGVTQAGETLLPNFPYLGTPYSGYYNPA